MARYNRNRRTTYRPESETLRFESVDNIIDDIENEGAEENLDTVSYPEPIELFYEEEPAEEVTEPEVTDISEPEPQKKGDEVAIAMKVIAGSYGATEEEIRSKLAEDGYSFEEITDVKKRILNGTYYN